MNKRINWHSANIRSEFTSLDNEAVFHNSLKKETSTLFVKNIILTRVTLRAVVFYYISENKDFFTSQTSICCFDTENQQGAFSSVKFIYILNNECPKNYHRFSITTESIFHINRL